MSLGGDPSDVNIHEIYLGQDLTTMFGDFTGLLGVYSIVDNPSETLTFTVGDGSVCPVSGFADADTVSHFFSLFSVFSAQGNRCIQNISP